MLFKDTYDLEVTCASADALQAFVTAMECSQRFDRTAIDEFDEVVKLDEEFALAHAALGRQLFMHGHGDQASTHFDVALSLISSVSPRERDAIKIAHAAVSGNAAAIPMAREHIAKYPADAFVLAHLLGPFGLLAFSGVRDWAAENVALINATKPRYREDDWWHLTTEGFFAAEDGRLSYARKICERAWMISENGNCAHSLAHLHFEACALDEGRDFILNWLDKYGDQSNMRHHLLWHLAMVSLESGLDVREIFENYDFELYPTANGPSPLEMLSDNASFLWRCHLAAFDIPASIGEDLHRYAESSFGFVGFAFADAHKSMASALQTNVIKRKAFNCQLAKFAASSGTEVAELVSQYSAAMCEFVEANYVGVVSRLEPLLADRALIGGSNPQRRIIEETYLEACIRNANYDKAKEVVVSRNRDQSISDQKLLQRIGQLEG